MTNADLLHEQASCPGVSALSSVTGVVLAGGFGTRLRSVLSDRPKVLAEVNERPFLFIILDQLVDAGLIASSSAPGTSAIKSGLQSVTPTAESRSFIRRRTARSVPEVRCGRPLTTTPTTFSW